MYFIDIQTKYCISVQFLAKFCMISKSDDELMNGIFILSSNKIGCTEPKWGNQLDWWWNSSKRSIRFSIEMQTYIGLQRL